MNLLWLQALSCSGNTQSFLCSQEPSVDEALRGFRLLFHPALTWDKEEEEVVEEVISGKEKLDVLILEGAVGDNLHSLAGMPFKEAIAKLCHRAEYVIAVGNCAVFGNLPAKSGERVSGLQYLFKRKGGFLGKDFKSKSGYPVINLSGCPAHPSWLAYALFMIREGRPIKLDEMGRPKEIYAFLTHHGCSRNEYFEWKVEAKSFGTKEGCLFYYLGCKGPMTHSSCNRVLWNGVSSKTRAGMPCVGCTEYDFPRENLFETKQLMNLPEELPLGVSKRGYILLSGITKTFAPERLKGRLIDEDNP